jgi:tetratricopeptide (TPR) repeat protein
MRLKVIAPLLVVAVGAGGYTLWSQAKDRAALEKERRFVNPYNESIAAFQQKRYTDAEAILTGLLPETEKNSPDSANLASVYHGLGAVTHLQHRNAEADGYYRKAVAIRTKVLAPDDPELASSLSGLCQTLHDEGLESDADVYDRQALVIYRAAPGKYRNEFATTLFNIGDFAMRQHHNQEAESLLKEAADYYEKFGTAKSKNLALVDARLGTLYLDEKRYPEADIILQKALTIQTARLTPDDPDLARTLQDIAVLRNAQGRTAEANALDKKASAIFAKATPTVTESAAALLIEQGNTFASQGEFTHAIDAYEKAIDADTKQFGADSPSIANDVLYLAWLYRDRVESRQTKAEPLFEQALAIREKSLGADAPGVAEVLSDEALLFFFEQKPERGVAVASRALTIQKKTFGPDSLEVSTTLNRLGLCQRDLQQFPQAEISLQRALAIREKQLPPDHTWIAVSLENLASVYACERAFDKAMPLTQRAREIRTKAAAANAASAPNPAS